MGTLPKVGFMPIRELFNQLSKRLGGIGGTNTSGADGGESADEERSAKVPTTEDLDAAVVKAEASPDEQETATGTGRLGESAGDAGVDSRRGSTTSAGGTVLEGTGGPAEDRPDSERPAGPGVDESVRSDARPSARSGGETKHRTDGDESKSVDVETATADRTDAVEATEADAVKADDRAGETPKGPVECRLDGCNQTFATAHGMKIHATKVHGEDVKPPHRDPERLREVYEAHNTFTEMTAALDVEVTPQTVRRSMAALGIHDPEDPENPEDPEHPREPENPEDPENPRNPDDPIPEDDPGKDSGDDGTNASERTDRNTASSNPATKAELNSGAPLEGCEQIEAALPQGIEGAELIAAIEEARTLYEVQRALELDRAETQTLLAELDLLDLVQCRLATKPDPEERRAELERRLSEGIDA